jgi:hypothetical protein
MPYLNSRWGSPWQAPDRLLYLPRTCHHHPVAIDSSLKTGQQRKPPNPSTDGRRRWPFPDLNPGDWFTFDVASIGSVRSCAQFQAKKHGQSFTVGKEPGSASRCVCIRLITPGHHGQDRHLSSPRR